MSNFRKFLALALAAVMVAGMMVFAAPAASAAVAGDKDHKDDIALLNAVDVMLGYGDGEFGGDDNVTRWQMALFIARIMTGETGNKMWEADKSDYFTDVKADHYPGAIDFCAEFGIIIGVGDNKFEPDEFVTYRDALTMIVRVLGYEEKTTTYPWGYILTARDIKTVNNESITADVDTGYTTPLKRKEVADLLAKILYSSKKGVQGTLLENNLDAEKIDGKKQIVSTYACSINGAAYAKYGEVGIDNGGEIVYVAESTISSDIDARNLLGFYCELIRVKDKYVATVDTIDVVDNFGGKTFTVKAENSQVTYTDAAKKAHTFSAADENLLVYGTQVNNVFVPATGDDFAAGKITTNGRLYVDLDSEIARFVPFTSVQALYKADVKITNTKNEWPVKETTLYYMPTKAVASTAAACKVIPKASVGGRVVPVVRLAYGSDSPAAGTWTGAYVNTSGTTAVNLTAGQRTEMAGWEARYFSDLYVAVEGELKNDELFLGNITHIGAGAWTTSASASIVFITVAQPIETAEGTAKLNGTKDADESIKLGDTYFQVGFAADVDTTSYAPAANYEGSMIGYASFADATADIEALAGTDVDYTTINGKVVSIVAHQENANQQTVAAKNLYTKDYVIVAGKVADIAFNADDTITLPVYDLATAAAATITVDQINGIKVAALVNQFGFETAKTLVGDKSVIDAKNERELVLGLLANSEFCTTYGDGKYGTAIAVVANKTGDIYSLSSDCEFIKQVMVGTTAGKEKAAKLGETAELVFKAYESASLSETQYAKGTFNSAKSSSTESKFDYALDHVKVSKAMTVTIIGSDGIKVYTDVIPATGDTLALKSGDGAAVLTLGSTSLVVADFTKACADIANFQVKSTEPTPVDNGGWFTLSWKTDYIGMEVRVENKVTYYYYTFDNMFNLATRKYETVVIKSETYYEVPETGIFSATYWQGNESPVNIKSNGTNQGTLNLYSVWYIEGNTLYRSSMISFGIANGYKFGRIKAISNNKVASATTGYEKIIDQYRVILDDIKYTADEVNGKYVKGTVTNDAIQLVVNWTLYTMNQSANSKADEMVTVDFALSNTTNSGYDGKAVSQNDLILYKFNENTGSLEMIFNFPDGVKATDAEVIDNYLDKTAFTTQN